MRGKHQEFADGVLADAEMNATRVYMRLYPKCGEEAARRNASRLLTRADIHTYMAERMKERAKRVEITQDFVLGGLKEVAQRCMQQVPVMTWDRQEKRHVQVEDENGQGVWEFDSGGANRALELLGKHLGVFSQDGDDEDAPAPTVVNVNIVDGRKA